MGPIYAYLREIERLEKCKQHSKQLLPARGSWHGLHQHTASCAIFNLGYLRWPTQFPLARRCDPTLILFPGQQSTDGFSVSLEVFTPDGIAALGKAHARSATGVTSKLSSKQFQCKLDWTRTVPGLGRPSTASFLHSSFLKAIGAVVLWSFLVQTVPQASQYFRSTKLRSTCDSGSACQFII